MAHQYEVLIVGAGPAGSALAYFLAKAGREVLLVDKAEFPRDKTCGDGLTPRALGVLRHMGLLEQVTAAGCHVKGIHLFTPDGQRVSAPIPEQAGLPAYVVVMPRYQLDDLLRAHAAAAGAVFRARVEALEILREGGQVVGVRAKTPDGPTTLRARQTVIATGAAAGLLDKAQMLAAQPQYGRAARGYYEGLGQVSDYIEFHLESVPLPGYGWVFPISATAANVGVGYFVEPGQGALRNSPRQVLDDFLANGWPRRRWWGRSRATRCAMTSRPRGWPTPACWWWARRPAW